MRAFLCFLLAGCIGCATPALGAPDLIVTNAKVTSFHGGENLTAFSVEDGVFTALSKDAASLLADKDPDTKVIDAGGRRVIPGLNDSHLHVVRGGRFYNSETRWEGIDSLEEALHLVSEQAKRTPEDQWVRVIGGWSPYQFKEKRMPSVDELNTAAPDTPVFILFLYSGGLLNNAGMRALGIDRNSVAPEGSRYERDADGNPTGRLIADPNPMILYRTIGALPPLDAKQQYNSSIQFYRHLLSLGETSAVDAGGGGHQFPRDYAASTKLAKDGELPIRISAFLFPQKPGEERRQFEAWMADYHHDQNFHSDHDNGYVIEGGGELLVWSASDYENFTSSRPDLKAQAETELEVVVRLHIENGWPFRIHATYDESIGRMLDVLERVNKTQPLGKVRWSFDHAETVSDKNLKRIKALGGGIAVQGRMAFAGEYFIERYGEDAARRAPPIRKMLELGIPVGLGTDGTRVSSFNPWATYYWVVSGRTVGGTKLYDADNRLDRLTALKLFTMGSAWFSGEERSKGDIAPGMVADFAILDRDILKVKEQELLGTSADLTVVNGEIEHASAAYPQYRKPTLQAIPNWSPVNYTSSP
ncbi:amidohydrolase [uncultured Microbulbifer sp.]|uniref:amidohydrolase n=1 Tax=uncultured Microbulbifer sp. TaxID=348147 RepID=UPI0025DEB190|nr:amidohydrolase [uncultured Microbulbifer sp.]